MVLIDCFYESHNSWTMFNVYNLAASKLTFFKCSKIVSPFCDVCDPSFDSFFHLPDEITACSACATVHTAS